MTGENKILRVDILHDAGRAINPAIELGQIEGGYSRAEKGQYGGTGYFRSRWSYYSSGAFYSCPFCWEIFPRRG